MTPDVYPTLAVVDSGVGGLSVLAELRRILPLNAIIYYADSANCPYGNRQEQEIVDLTLLVVEFVVSKGAQVVVVACNTMTAAAIDLLREKWPNVDFVGMEPAVKPAATQSKTGVVGILATKATLNGRLYQHTRDEYAANARVIETIGEGLVEFVESDQIDSAQCEEVVRSYVMPMIEQGADRIVLGCTHYPFLTPVIQKIIGDRPIEIINPAPAVARRAAEFMRRRQLVVQIDGRQIDDLQIEDMQIDDLQSEDRKSDELRSGLEQLVEGPTYYYSSKTTDDAAMLKQKFNSTRVVRQK